MRTSDIVIGSCAGALTLGYWVFMRPVFGIHDYRQLEDRAEETSVFVWLFSLVTMALLLAASLLEDKRSTVEILLYLAAGFAALSSFVMITSKFWWTATSAILVAVVAGVAYGPLDEAHDGFVFEFIPIGIAVAMGFVAVVVLSKGSGNKNLN